MNTLMHVTDFWLVAAALAGHHTLVTHGVESPSTRKIKIPNVRIGWGVEFVSPYQMLRREQARFILEPTPAAS